MIRARLHLAPADMSPSLAALNQTFASLKDPVILGGCQNIQCWNGFSCWLAEPLGIFEFHSGNHDPFEKLDNILNQYRIETSDLPQSMFKGGWVGFFAYELNRFIETLPPLQPDTAGLPLIRLAFYDRFIIFDHSKNEFFLAALELSNDGAGIDSKFARLRDLLESASKIEVPDFTDSALSEHQLNESWARDNFLSALDKVKHHIHEGDIYQANVSHCIKLPFHGRPIDLYNWQCKHNPSPFAAYLDTDSGAIVSASPEMFVTIAGGEISTCPIKGTRPRLAPDTSQAVVQNEINCRLLENCEKEKAELNMIIDLERNDLGRICLPGSIRVTSPRSVVPYPTVFHALATITGRLRDHITFSDILKAAFPGGSITGAPKIRAMEIIDSLEKEPRGIYTGSIGFITPHWSACLNIAIRTVIIRSGAAFLRVGSGIVADSDPLREWDETLAKALALVNGIENCKPKGCK